MRTNAQIQSEGRNKAQRVIKHAKFVQTEAKAGRVRYVVTFLWANSIPKFRTKCCNGLLNCKREELKTEDGDDREEGPGNALCILFPDPRSHPEVRFNEA